ncbi:thioesterase [Fulvivirgaceae bacterium BMA12]|uniref:Thioesterase n=1 Tax=Agaribacillus aureus TaxID=3051825 RepID=A0ABT8LB04_9BACT|nr:thioesterase [Fulvivirgaceae bacterium BMA12]
MTLKSVWQESFRVKSYETDKDKSLKLHVLFYYLQECAWNHANHLQIGYQELIQQDLIWVLSKIKINMEQYPVWEDEVTVTTWPKSWDSLFAIRDFEITNSRGQRIGGATSAWLMVNIKKRRPQKIDHWKDSIPLNKKHGLNEELPKINAGNSPVYEEIRKVYPHEIDLHHHVNNAEYIKWITDLIGRHFEDKKAVEAIQINFQNEIFDREEITMGLDKMPDGSDNYYLHCTNRDCNKLGFNATVSLKNKYLPT